jgi:hypothetical protein
MRSCLIGSLLWKPPMRCGCNSKKSMCITKRSEEKYELLKVELNEFKIKMFNSNPNLNFTTATNLVKQISTL